MRLILLLSPLVLLASCAGPGPDPVVIASQEAACRTAIADHVRRPESEVATRWLSGESGIATIEAIDDTRRHLCLVDGAGRVLDYQHPDD